MQCPRCTNQLIVLELHEIEIDYCTECSGIWLDQGELGLLLDDVAKKDEFLSSFAIEKGNHEKVLKCPICKTKMNKVLVEGVQNLTIDECKNLCGIWFDDGELLDIIKMGTETENHKVVGLLEEMFEYKLKNKSEE